MKHEYSESELEAYLDEAMSPDEMAAVEKSLREDPSLLKQLAAINGRRDAGMHSLGAIWRRHRLSCPSREQLGSFLLGAVKDEWADYIQFHVKTVGCAYCRASLEDLKLRQQESREAAATRRNKYFQSSAGYLSRHRQ